MYDYWKTKLERLEERTFGLWGGKGEVKDSDEVVTELLMQVVLPWPSPKPPLRLAGGH